jgi:CheY-like chemotaxis protein
VTQPLALVLYEKLLPGSQLVNRLQDLGYRVLTVTDVDTLGACAEQEKPMLVFADLVATRAKVCDAISRLKTNPATAHLPIIAFADEKDAALQTAARQAGATLVVSDAAILTHLEPFLEQALRLD